MLVTRIDGLGSPQVSLSTPTSRGLKDLGGNKLKQFAVGVSLSTPTSRGLKVFDRCLGVTLPVFVSLSTPTSRGLKVGKVVASDTFRSSFTEHPDQ